MKKTLLIVAMLALALSACVKKEDMAVDAQSGRLISPTTYGDEVCYRGVVYVQFGAAQSSWGGPKFNTDGNVALCNKPN